MHNGGCKEEMGAQVRACALVTLKEFVVSFLVDQSIPYRDAQKKLFSIYKREFTFTRMRESKVFVAGTISAMTSVASVLVVWSHSLGAKEIWFFLYFVYEGGLP